MVVRKQLGIGAIAFVAMVVLSGVLGCQGEQSSPTAQSEQARVVGARLQAGNVPRETWIATDSVVLKATTTANQVLLDTGFSVAGKTGIVRIRTFYVRADQGVDLSAKGYQAGRWIWQGFAQGSASNIDQTIQLDASLVDSVPESIGPSLGIVSAPVFIDSSRKSWARDTFAGPVGFVASSATPGARIHYTLDGSLPTSNSTRLMSGQILVPSSSILSLRAFLDGWTPSEIVVRRVVVKAQSPTLRQGALWTPYRVGISSPDTGVVFRYTLDRSVPDSTSLLYRDSIVVAPSSGLVSLRVRAFPKDPRIEPSSVASVDFDEAVAWNPAIAYGILRDSRDSQVYRTVKIGHQTWMAENLRWRTDSSRCYADSAIHCEHAGRLYSWADAMQLMPECNTVKCQALVQTPHRGVCPEGWHVPDSTEWRTLQATTSPADSRSGTQLMGKTTAYPLTTKAFEAGDPHGFRAVLGGNWSQGHYSEWGTHENWWSAQAWVNPWLGSSGGAFTIPPGFTPGASQFHIRCLQNTP